MYFSLQSFSFVFPEITVLASYKTKEKKTFLVHVIDIRMLTQKTYNKIVKLLDERKPTKKTVVKYQMCAIVRCNLFINLIKRKNKKN